MRSATFPVVLAVAVALAIPGCSTEHRVTGPIPWQPPTADSPANAVRLFEWGWDHRDLEAFRQVLAGDLGFVFAQGDSAGNVFHDGQISRDEMLVILRHLFVGGGTQPPAISVSLTLDPTLIALDDNRPGKNGKWHKEIVTTVNLTVMTADQGEYRVSGHARFFVVRGDSAAIPADLAAEGVGPDPTRWYIEQWNDETLTGVDGLLRALPAKSQAASDATWGQILALYRPWAPD